MRILMIEDEWLIAEPTEEILKKHNYSVDVVGDGEAGLDYGLSGVYDLILLDVMLPKMDGFEILRHLRKAGIKTPVLMLTAKGQIEDKIMGLDFGADDYLPKPFDYQELLARMRALLRRSGALDETNTLKIANLELNPLNLTLTSDMGMQKLTLKESQLLGLLIQRKNMATPKDLILDKLWDFDSDVDGSHVEYHISNLRKKMKQIHSLAVIKTERGLGYILKVGGHG